MSEDKETEKTDSAGDLGAKSQWSYKEWYEKNKEALSQRRKNRYHGDSKYKNKILAQNRHYRARSKNKNSPEEKTSSRVRVPKHRKPVAISVSVNGQNQEVSMVHIGVFARSIGRSVPTVYQWERVGLLPRTPFSLDSKNKQERLYTADMIEVVRKALSTRGAYVFATDTDFHREIKEGWARIGVIAEE